MTSIGRGAFAYCRGMISITIPVSVTSIDKLAFDECSSLTDVYYAGNNVYWNKIEISEDNDYLTDATRHYIINGTELTWTLDDEDTVTVSGTGAMANYEGTGSPWYNNASVKAVVISDGVTSIGEGAFWSCSSLESITIHVSVTSIGDLAFYKCGGLTSVYYDGSKKDWEMVTIGVGNDKLTAAKVNYIPELVCTSSVLNGNIVIQVASDEVISTKDLHIAIYSDENAMLNYIIVPHFGEYSTINTVFRDIPEAAYAKVFLWESVSEMEPITAAQTVNIVR